MPNCGKIGVLVYAIAVSGCQVSGEGEGGEETNHFDPSHPGVKGTIALGNGTASSDYETLVLRWSPDNSVDETQIRTHSLSTIAFPYEYEIGIGLGASEYQTWDLQAWMTARAGPHELPENHEPQATQRIEFEEDCSDGCDPLHDVNLVLN